MFDKKLAELFVEINAIGIQATSQEIARLKEASDTALKSLNASTGSAEQFGAKALIAYDMAKNAVMGFYHAGVSGTAEMERFTIQMSFLSREVASIFVPVLDRATDAVERVVHWFESLSGAQQDSLMYWGLGAAAAASFVTVLPKITAAGNAAALGIRGLASAFTFAGVASGGLLPLLGLIGTTLAGLAVGSAAGREAFGDSWRSLQPIFADLAASVSNVGTEIAALARTEGFVLTLAVAFKSVELVVSSIAKLLTHAARGLLLLVNTAKHGLGKARDIHTAAFAQDVAEEKKRQQGFGAGHRTVARNDVGFEDVTAAYKRIQTSFLRVASTKKIQEDQLDRQREIAEATKKTASILEHHEGGLR